MFISCNKELQEDCSTAVDEIYKKQTVQHSRMGARVLRHQSFLQGAAHDVAEWSTDMCDALATQHRDIETYFTQELQRDAPAGDYCDKVVLIFFFSSLFDCPLINHLIFKHIELGLWHSRLCSILIVIA